MDATHASYVRKQIRVSLDDIVESNYSYTLQAGTWAKQQLLKENFREKLREVVSAFVILVRIKTPSIKSRLIQILHKFLFTKLIPMDESNA